MHKIDIKTSVNILNEITVNDEEDELGYSYLISIRPHSRDITDDKDSNFYIDGFVEIPRSEMKRMEEWIDVYTQPLNPLDPLTEEEVTKVTGITPMKIPLRQMKLRARFNPGTTIHLFHTQFKMTIEMFETFISFPDKEKLKQSRIY